MRYRNRISFVSLLLCVFALNLFLVFSAASQDTPRPTRFLLISLDGARPDALLLADTPHIQALAARGAVSWQAETVLPSVTLPAHTSMLTGLSVEQHGVDYNSTQPGCPLITPPTVLTLAEAAGHRAALVAGKEKFCLYQQSETLDYTFAREGDRSVADRVLELLDADYTAIFAHFPNPDYFGHSTGWMSDTYISELSSTDHHVGRVLAKLDQLNLTDETLVILTADHGGHDFGHGSDLPEDRQIPWIIAGPGVISGAVLTDAVSVIDTTPTILYALGLPLPPDLSGRPITEAFTLPFPVDTTPEANGP